MGWATGCPSLERLLWKLRPSIYFALVYIVDPCALAILACVVCFWSVSPRLACELLPVLCCLTSRVAATRSPSPT